MNPFAVLTAKCLSLFSERAHSYSAQDEVLPLSFVTKVKSHLALVCLSSNTFGVISQKIILFYHKIVFVSIVSSVILYKTNISVACGHRQQAKSQSLRCLQRATPTKQPPFTTNVFKIRRGKSQKICKSLGGRGALRLHLAFSSIFPQNRF